jgi:hypothetical protein
VVGFDGRVPTIIVLNLKVVFNEILIRIAPEDEELDAPAQGWRMVFSIGHP